MINTKKFTSRNQMFQLLLQGMDLYNPDLGKYVFCYNDRGAVCTYDMDIDTFCKLRDEAVCKHEKISSLLGCGGSILDDARFTGDSVEERTKYLKPTLEFCNKTYHQGQWYVVSKELEEVAKACNESEERI